MTRVVDACSQVIVKTLSENKAFQQFALRTAKKGGQVMSEASSKAEKIKGSQVRCLPHPKRLVAVTTPCCQREAHSGCLP